MSTTGSRVSIPPPTAVRLLQLLLAASLAVPALLFAGTCWQDRRALVAQAAQRAETSAEVLEQHAVAAFHAYELIFARVDEHLRAVPGEDEPTRHAYLASIDHDLKEVGSLFLLDAAGRVTAHSRFSPVRPLDVSDRDYFSLLAGKHDGDATSPLDASGLAVGVPNIGRLSGTAKLNIARAITTPDGHFAGAIVISVAQEYFEAFHRKLAASRDDSMVLVREDGAVLARSPSLSGASLRVLADQDHTQAMIARIKDTNASTFRSSVDGVERIADYRKLASYPIYVGYGVALTAVLQVWHRHVAVYGAVTLFASSALFAVTWLAMRAAREEAQARADLVGEMGRREAAEAALRQSQKMEAVGQLTGGVAHDFNNLLAAIMGNLELLAKRLPDDARLHRYVAGALEGAKRGAGLTQRMLAFARRQDLRLEAVDIPVLVHGMANLIERSLGPAISVETRFPVGLAPAHVDPNQLEAALLNLAVNARDAMPKGGRITLSAREEAVGLGNPFGLKPDRYVVLAVADEGDGMEAATLARAAEPFFTTKPVGKGTGLGLAMVHGLAAQSGGTLRIESEPGRGTTVSIWLCATTGESPQAPAPTLRGVQDNSLRRVLLVDDDRLVRENTCAMLEDLGHDVVAVASAAEALAVVRSGRPVDLVITDHMMPGMTGVDLAAKLAKTSTVPVLLASGYVDLSDREATDVPRLSKPFTQAALAEAIAALSDRATVADRVVPMRRRVT